MCADLTRKRRIRAGHRGVVTKRLGEIKAIVEALGSPEKRDLERYVAIFHEKLEVLHQLDREILELLTEKDDILREIAQAEEYNQVVVDTQLKLRELLSGTMPTSASKAPQNARLPKLNLQEFDGDITQWLPFWDRYEAAVHSNEELSAIQKYTYLRSLVEGQAKEAIAGLSLSTENYSNAVKILKKRFGNKQSIIAKHMDILLNIEQVTAANNLVALRRLQDQVEANTRALQSLGVDPESYGTLLSSVIMKKLPQEIRILISRKITDEWDLNTIIQVVGEELGARERALPLKEGGGESCPPSRSTSLDKPSVAGLLAGQTPSEKHTCVYFKLTHSSSDCPTVISTDERKKMVKVEGRCFNCLRKGHMGRECHSKAKRRSCHGKHCHGKHHTSLCHKKSPSKSSTSAGTKRSETTQLITNTDHAQGRVSSIDRRSLNPEAQPFEHGSNTTAISCLVEGRKTVLLQTAIATLHNPTKQGTWLDVPILFDTGSHKSYICQKIVDHLQLPVKGKRPLNIMIFGSTTGSYRCCDIIHVKIGKGAHQSKVLSV